MAMMQGGGGGSNMFRNMDLRIVLIVMAIAFSLGLALAADNAVFVSSPQSKGHAIISLVTVFSYSIMGDRAMSFVLSTVIFLGIIGGGGAIIFQIISIHIIEPMMIRRKISDLKREKELINKLDDGTI